MLTLHLSSSVGTRPDLGRQKIWPQMWAHVLWKQVAQVATCCHSGTGRSLAIVCPASAAQQGWTGVVPVSGGTGTDSTVPPALGQPQQLWSFGAQGKARSRAARSNSNSASALALPSLTQRAATGGEQGIGLLSMKWGRTV